VTIQFRPEAEGIHHAYAGCVCVTTHDAICACGGIIRATDFVVDGLTVVLDCPRCFTRLIEIAPR
jgi:hypothetical protein